MYYKIVASFGVESGQKWKDYLQWRGLSLTRFDSVDGMLRPDLFVPETAADWAHCVNADFKLSLLTDLAYARRQLTRFSGGELVGVALELESGYQPLPGLLGYDILDAECQISLLTNWGTDEEGMIDPHLEPNGLMAGLENALRLRDLLRRRFPEDPHAAACGVWGVYQVGD